MNDTIDENEEAKRALEKQNTDLQAKVCIVMCYLWFQFGVISLV